MKDFLKSPKFLISLTLLLVIIFIAAFLRFVNLNSLPIFVDEAIYIRWAQVMRAEPTLRFLPLSDGKQPLFMWAIISGFKIFNDPLIAGRAISILSGLGTIVGIFFLSHQLFRSNKVALMASTMYAISPYGVFFDRLALVDSMLAMWGVWTLLFSLITVKTRRLDAAMFTGLFLGAAFITKSPALFFFISLPFSLLFFRRDKDNPRISFVYTAFLLLISWGIGLFIFNLLRLGPNFHLIFSRNLDYVYPISRIFTNPTDPFISNFKEYLSWLVYFGPYPVLFLLLIGLKNIKKYYKQLLLLAIWGLAPVLAQSEFSIAFTARYVLFTIPFLFILASSSVLLEKKWSVFVVIFFVWFAGLSLQRNYLLIKNPVKAKMPEGERSGYLEEWTAGFGIKTAAEKIIDIRNSDPEARILVATEGYFGTMPDGLQVYLEKEPNITVLGVGLDIKEPPIQLIEHKKAGGRSFLAANSSRLKFNEDYSKWGLKEIYSIKKPSRSPSTHGYVSFGENDTFYLFELVEIVEASDIVLTQ